MISKLLKAYLTYGEVELLATEYARAKVKLFELMPNTVVHHGLRNFQNKMTFVLFE